MKTCKDCVHLDVCMAVYGDLMYGSGTFMDDSEQVDKDCRFFKDNTKLIELPCSVGDKVYTVVYQKVYEAEVVCIRPFVFESRVEYRGNVIITFENPFYNDGRLLEQELFCVFGKDTFLTREEAEKKLVEVDA